MATDDQLRECPFEAFRGELPAKVIQVVVDDPMTQVRLPDGRAAWLVLGYDEVCTVLADQRFTRFVDQLTTYGVRPPFRISPASWG